MSKSVGCTACTGQMLGKCHKMVGLSYVEVLVATALIALALVPAMEALQPGIEGSGIHETFAEDHYLLSAKMEEVLAEPFDALDSAAAAAGDQSTPTSYSDIVNASDGRQVSRQVFLSPYDGDNADSDNDPFTGTDAGLLWVRVDIENTAHTIETLTNAYP